MDVAMKVVVLTQSVTETLQLGKRMGRLLRSGEVVALTGELGSGKTHFIKGLAAGLGVERPDYITSPSFTLIHEYTGRIPFYHIDLFRLATEEEIEDLGLEEYLGRKGVAAVEWADRISTLLPKELLWINMRYLGPSIRSIQIVGEGPRYEALVKEFSGSP
jgi:tRNA threonylcarbamoyladenosine biosynthesis protein TsaE